MTDDEIRALWVRGSRMWEWWPYPAADTELAMVDMGLWHDMFDDLSVGTVSAAMLSLASRDKFPPPGLLRDTAVRLQNQLDGRPPIPDVDEAWDEVMWAVRHVGRYDTPEWSHSAVGATVRAIGWLEVCNCTELGVMRGQFARLYETCKGRVERESIPPPPALAAFMAAGLKRVDDVLAIGPGENGSSGS